MFREKSLDFHERFVCFRYLKRMPYVQNERPSLKDGVRAVCGGFIGVSNSVIQKHLRFRSLQQTRWQVR